MSPPPLQSSLPAGWLGLYREGVEPSGALQKVSDQKSHPPFLDLSWRKGSFIACPCRRAGMFDYRTCYDFWSRILIRCVEAARPVLEHVRERPGHEATYIELERLYDKWKALEKKLA